MTKSRDIQIIGLHRGDAFYKDREKFIGKKGSFIPVAPHHYPGYFAGEFRGLGGERSQYFLAIRYRRI